MLPWTRAQPCVPPCVQIVGFFLVEDRVQRSNQDAASPVQVDASWESAIACLKTVLEGGFETVAAAALMLAVKDFMLLVCSSLGETPPWLMLPSTLAAVSFCFSLGETGICWPSP